MLPVVFVLACSDDPAAPSIEIVHPTADDSLAVGPFSVTVRVENFVLKDRAKHTDAEPEGAIVAWMGDVYLLTTTETTFDVSTDAMGTYTFGVELLLTNGDPLDPPAQDDVILEIE